MRKIDLVDTWTGIMGHRNERGRMCIEIFALNDRDQLVADRRRACREAWRLLNDLMTPGGDQDAARELTDILAGKRSFSMAQRGVIEEAKSNWQQIFRRDGRAETER